MEIMSQKTLKSCQEKYCNYAQKKNNKITPRIIIISCQEKHQNCVKKIFKSFQYKENIEIMSRLLLKSCQENNKIIPRKRRI